MTCGICHKRFSKNVDLNEHLKEAHQLSTDVTRTTFKSWDEFEDWRDSKERRVNHKLIQKGRNMFHDGSMAYKRLVCSRSRKNGKRDAKGDGNGFATCSCFIIAKRKTAATKEVDVEYCFTHYGHEELNKPVASFPSVPKSQRTRHVIPGIMKDRILELIKEGVDKTGIIKTIRDEFNSDDDEADDAAMVNFKDISAIARKHGLKNPQKHGRGLHLISVQPYNESDRTQVKEDSPPPEKRRTPGPGRLTKFKSVRSYFSGESEQSERVGVDSLAAEEFRPEEEILEENLMEITAVVTEISEKTLLVKDSETAVRILDQLRETEQAMTEILAGESRGVGITIVQGMDD